MATKIKLGNRPKNFKRAITVPLPGGEAGSVEVSFKYRTRSEHAAWADQLQAELKARGEQEVARIKAAIANNEALPEMTQAELVASQNAFQARCIMESVDGWNLDVPFDEQAVAELVDTMPAAASAIIADYRAAIVEGRLGN